MLKKEKKHYLHFKQLENFTVYKWKKAECWRSWKVQLNTQPETIKC